LSAPQRRRLLADQPSRDRLEQIIRERPYVAQLIQTQILYDMAGILENMSEDMAQLRSEFKDSRPQGLVGYVPVNVTEQETTLLPQNQPTMPWRKMTIINDGADPVWVYTSPRRAGLFQLEKTPIPPGQDYEVDMRFPLIDQVVLKCDEGDSATVRIIPVV